MAGHPLLARHRAAAVDMASDGERAPSRRLPTRVRAASTYRTSPANKGKTSPSKVTRRSAAAVPILLQPRGEPIMDRRGNQHDAATGRFTRKAASSAPSVATDARPSSQAESGRSSPSFRSITSSVFHAHIAAGDTSDEDDPKPASPGADMLARLQEAERNLGAMRAEMEGATDDSEKLLAELKTLRSEHASALSEIDKLRGLARDSAAAIRTEMQTHTDQLLEQINDEHAQVVADLESEIDVLRSQHPSPAVIKPKTVKEVSLSPINFSEDSSFSDEDDNMRDHPQPTAQTADKIQIHYVYIYTYINK